MHYSLLVLFSSLQYTFSLNLRHSGGYSDVNQFYIISKNFEVKIYTGMPLFELILPLFQVQQ
jgi:hypothetical protein